MGGGDYIRPYASNGAMRTDVGGGGTLHFYFRLVFLSTFWGCF